MWLRTYLFAILAASATAFAANWTGSAVEPENMKKIDGKAFYVITSAEELAWFANQVNSGKTTINAILNNDIVFGANTSSTCSKAWTPIGKDSSHIFNGIIDGGFHTIYGLYINDAKFAGFVGIMGVNGIVKKMTLTVGNIKATKTSNYVGGFVAISSGKIDSVVNKNSISTSGQNGAGIVGWNANSALISNARNEATLSFNGMGGGIASKNDGSILNSINKGNISISVSHTCFASNASYTYYLGGIVGENNGSLAYVINEGSISATSKATGCFRSSVGKWYSTTVNTYQGGIAGINRANAKSSKSSNSGTLSYSGTNGQAGNTSGGGGYANGIVGGVAGRNEGQIDNSCNFDSRNIVGETSGKIINSFSVGKATYWANNVSKAYTTENMKKNQFAWVLNTTDGTTSNSGIWSRNDGYPTFANNSYKAIYKVVFDDDGTTSNRYTNYKGQVSFPENPEAPEGLVFSGWYNSDDIKVKPTTVFTADQTVKAIYTDASDIFWTITFYNAAPADTVLESKSYQHGSIVAYGGVAPTLASTAQYSYTFKGWDVEPTNAVEDFEYHAVYDSTVRSYAITFNNYDDSKIESATFEYGKMASCSKVPTRAATAEWKYSHKGWRPALDYVTEAATYTAIYDSSKVEYKVTFMNGTTVIDEQMVPYGDAAVAPTNVTREGYKFVGWNTSFAKVTEALTVKALFEELIIRTVNVVDGEGDEIANVTVEDGETYTLPEAPKKDGYTFDAYYDGDKKLGVAGDEIAVTANITIIAKYIANPKSSSSSVVSSSSETPKSSSSIIASSSSNVESSSSSVKSSSSSQPSAVYGVLVDNRDGQKYRTVVIGSQTWMAENLNYVTSESWCYKDDTSNCTKYGRLYRQGVAAQACPSGWHLPSKNEFQVLFDYVGGTSTAGSYLKTTSGWNNNSNGNDQYGFSALPGGIRRENGYYYDIGGHAIFWMSDKRVHVDVVGASDVRIGSDNVNYGFSVRCLMTPNSSSSIASSSSTAKSSSSVVRSSSSSMPKSSSSSVKSSSSSRVKSSSSTKTEAIVATTVPQFSVQVNGRNLQISTARVGSAYMLFDMQGRVLLQGRVQTANFEIPIARSGNYLIRIGNNVQRVAVK